MVKRRGTTSLGCLFTLLVIATVVYFGVTIGKPFWQYVQFKDAMVQEARFASHRTDAVIRRRLREKAIELGLPESAANVRVRRANGIIFIFTEYYEHVELPGFVREFYFAPHAQGPF